MKHMAKRLLAFLFANLSHCIHLHRIHPLRPSLSLSLSLSLFLFIFIFLFLSLFLPISPRWWP